MNLRYDRNGVAGKDKSKLGTTGGNFLGLYDATVNIYEIDDSFDPNEPDCVATQLIASGFESRCSASAARLVRTRRLKDVAAELRTLYVRLLEGSSESSA